MDIKEKVKDILSELSGKESVEIEESLQGDLGFDSILMVTMLVQIEDVFGIELNESDMNPFDLKTVQSVIDLVDKYFNNKSE